MQVELSRVHFPVVTLGPGRRIGIWFQGCTIGCRGCISRDTWSKGTGNEMRVGDLIDWIDDEMQKSQVDGITISGGEPFEQPGALLAILQGIRCLKLGTADFDILVYSGFGVSRIKTEFDVILALCDAVIANPYKSSRGQPTRLRGSANQVILSQSNRGDLIADWDKKPADTLNKLQLVTSGSSFSVIGIPNAGDLERVSMLAEAQGVGMESVSWR